ncbi:lipopolysaccharide biosynthesis protein [Leptolyngbya sp. FACHB-261]|uniref:lipopolysaccharide biosynthesis protein n=1 Tax=Leptolyngbya sp. FACHB-261 TaxID=2692806 RepID=UPI00168461F8|nr:lipopolysaccharide biosynthesis protein [Leptolyngbya sp. FACHB-261]MBD2105158.1 lipopolysaccharide biosynthesis protein [Leptolyngbya sp. FACHB-261]
MISAQGIIAQIKRKLSDKFIQNLGWLGGSQLVVRFFRLATTVVLARLLSPTDYGLAALVLTTNEFVNVFTRSGVVTKLIQAREEELEPLCETAYWFNWILFSFLFIVQCLIAYPVSLSYQHNTLILPICLMGMVYLILPLGIVQCALIQRESRLKIVAICNTLQLSSDCVLTVIFAFLDMGMWAVILPKVLVAPIWVAFYYFNHSWRPKGRFTLKHWRSIFDYSRSILGIELLTTLRNNVDYLLVGRFLGVQALGIYYFAFNAGLGISLSVITACSSALFPYLCAVNTDLAQLKSRFFSGLRTIALITVPLILIQSSLAPWYVPIVFSQKWTEAGAIPVLILICLSALPRPFADAASQLTCAVGKPQINLQWNLIFTIMFVIAIGISTQWGILGVATAVLLAHITILPIFTVWVGRYVFDSHPGSYLKPEH